MPALAVALVLLVLGLRLRDAYRKHKRPIECFQLRSESISEDWIKQLRVSIDHDQGNRHRAVSERTLEQQRTLVLALGQQVGAGTDLKGLRCEAEAGISLYPGDIGRNTPACHVPA